MDAQSAQPMCQSLIHIEDKELHTVSENVSTRTAPPGRSLIGWLLYRCGLVLSGITWICLASTLCGCAPLSGWVMNSSGRGYYRYGHYSAARFEFERALMDQPCNPNYAHNLAKALTKEGNLARAEQVYQHALRIDPAHQPSYSGLSELLMLQGRHADATQLLTAWADTQPYNPAAQMELARLYRQTGNFTSAEQRLFQAYHLSPYDPYVTEQLGALYQQTGRPQQAAMLYHQSLAVNPFQADVAARLSSLTPRQPPSPMFMAQSAPVPYYQSPGIHQGMTFGGQPAAYMPPSMPHGPVPAGQMAHGPAPQHLPMPGASLPATVMAEGPYTNAPHMSDPHMSPPMTAQAGVQYHGWSPAPPPQAAPSASYAPPMVMHGTPVPAGLPQAGPQQYGPHLHGQLHGQPAYAPGLPPQFAPQQGTAGPHGLQPVELGSPIPVTHQFHQGAPMMGSPIPTVNAF
jgi:Flp pilus assembly protein TadD